MLPQGSRARSGPEPMHEAKQMTTGQPVGAASHTTDGFSTAVRIGSTSVSSRSAFVLHQAASSFFMGASWSARVGWMGKSSPVLRGLGARDGARLLDEGENPRF